MKKFLIGAVVLLTVSFSLAYILLERKIEASIEIIRRGPDGTWAEFRFTNHGPVVYFVGEKDVPGCAEVKEDDQRTGGSILCFPPETTLKSGESFSFYGKSTEKGAWRYAIYLFKRDTRAVWLRKAAEFFHGEQEDEFRRISSEAIVSLKEAPIRGLD